MTSVATGVIATLLAACASRTPPERERALSKLPSAAQLVAAADGTALAPFKPVIDAGRTFLPTTLNCVADAALTSEAVAVAITPRVGTTIVVVTRAHVACPALSRIGGDMFVATLGNGGVVDKLESSPLGDPRWARARPYLEHDPIALAIEREGESVLAVAQPAPLAAWVAIDSLDLAPSDRAVRAWLDRQRTTALAPLAANMHVDKRGSQLLVRPATLDADQLALVVVDVLRALESPAHPAGATLACPPNDADILRCTDGTHFVVRSLTSTLRKLIAVNTEPVVQGGDIIGIRLSEDAEVLLRRGDVILGLEGHRISSAAQLHELARYAHDKTVLAIRRDDADVILELSE